MFSLLKRSWFPLALIVLFLLAVPGVILVILAVANLDAPVNVWLRDNFQITYQLTLAPALVFFMLGIPLVILLLYFLKLKRKPMQVPSTFLWRKSIEDLHVNALLQWLRQNVLLLLQLLAILFMIYSVLGLRFHGASSEGKHYILLIDNSASMSATDVKPSRLQWAKQEALKLIDAAGDNDYGMVVSFNSKASTLQAYTNNRIKLREAIRSIEQTYRLTRLEEALTLIDGLANPVARPKTSPSGPNRRRRPARNGLSCSPRASAPPSTFSPMADSPRSPTPRSPISIRARRASRRSSATCNRFTTWPARMSPAMPTTSASSRSTPSAPESPARIKTRGWKP